MKSDNPTPPVPFAEQLAAIEFKNLLALFSGIATKVLTGQPGSCVPKDEKVH